MNQLPWNRNVQRPGVLVWALSRAVSLASRFSSSSPCMGAARSSQADDSFGAMSA